MLILDASSSMVEADGEGTRMESAKKAANELVESLPETAKMGLMAYGANETDAPDNRERGCKDVETLAKVGKIDKAKFTSAIDGLEQKGYTPMGNSLRKAAEELGDEGALDHPGVRRYRLLRPAAGVRGGQGAGRRRC